MRAVLRSRRRRILLCAASLHFALGQGAVPAGAAAPDYQTTSLRSLEMESAALLLSGQEGGTLPLRAAALPAGYEDGRLRVAVWAEVELAVPPGVSGNLDFAVYAMAGGEVRASDLRAFSFSSAGPRHLRLVTSLLLAPGSYSLRMLVRDRSGEFHAASGAGRGRGEVGLRTLDVTIPQPGATAVFPPLFLETPILEFDTFSADGARSGALIPAGAARAAPRAIVRGGAPQAILVPVWRSSAAPTSTLEVRKPGQPAAQHIALTGEQPAGASLGFLRGELPLFDLEAGDYELAAPGQASAALRLRVVETATAARRPNALPDRSGRQRGAAATAAQEYRRALDALARGAHDEARQTLDDLEIGMLRSGAIDPDDLRTVELREAEALAKVSAEALLPAVVLAIDLYEARRRTGEPAAATHSREVAASIVEILVAHGGDRLIAAQAMLALAAKLNETTPLIQRRFLTTAVELDPSATGAWLALAIGAERQGDFAKAQQYIAGMLETNPGTAAATLRLAVYALRTGQVKEAQTRLEAVAASKTPATAEESLVRAQEASRLQLALGAPKRAAEEARAGLATAPGDEKLQLLLATALQAMGRGAEASDALAAIRPSPKPNPRWIFSQSPAHILAAARPLVAERAEAAQLTLERALTATASRAP